MILIICCVLILLLRFGAASFYGETHVKHKQEKTRIDATILFATHAGPMRKMSVRLRSQSSSGEVCPFLFLSVFSRRVPDRLKVGFEREERD